VAKSGPRESRRPHVDIAVVGAGIAGLYLASRLLSEPKYQVKSIALFDTADRVGGRILSVFVPEVPYIADLGAMRYLPEQIPSGIILSSGATGHSHATIYGKEPARHDASPKRPSTTARAASISSFIADRCRTASAKPRSVSCRSPYGDSRRRRRSRTACVL
jgi:monoamine oxidase